MTEQVTAAALRSMSPAQIITARTEGRLATLLGAPAADVALIDRASGQLTRDDLTALKKLGRHDLILAAHKENRITNNTEQKD
jgi:hypothetical protein